MAQCHYSTVLRQKTIAFMRTLKIIWDLHAKQRGWTYRRTGWWIVKCTVVCISLLRNHLWNVARLEVPFFAFFSLVFSNIRINCLFLRLLIFVSSGSEGLQYHMCFYFLCQGHIRENATKDAWLLISFLFVFFFYIYILNGYLLQLCISK